MSMQEVSSNEGQHDLIYDSTSEDLKITIPDLTPGLHVVTLRITDARGNAFYKAELVEIKEITSNRRQLQLHREVEPLPHREKH